MLAAAVALTATACGKEQRMDDATTDGEVGTAYGDDPSQFGELLVPEGRPHGVVVVIHGGFWRAEYDLSLGRPLAEDLVARGWVTWNLEYRRVGNGGGVPATLDDVHAGIDHLARLADAGRLPEAALGRVVVLGHSAGGHLAAWAGGRDRHERWSAPLVPVTHVISQSGVLDLVTGSREGLGGGAVDDFLGHPAGADDAAVDPAQQVPLDVPVWCVHAPDDDIVPISYSRRYVERATAAGGTAELVEVPGGHFGVIEVGSPAWDRIRAVIDAVR